MTNCRYINAVILVIFMYAVIKIIISNAHEHGERVPRQKRSLMHINGSILQFAFGVQSPVDIPNRTISLAVGLQANYKLPHNYSELRYNVREKRELQQLQYFKIYEHMEQNLHEFGYDGRDCLLRSICELAKHPFHTGHPETLFEEILHIILTPSVEHALVGGDRLADKDALLESFQNEDPYISAEIHGRKNGDCKFKYPACEDSPLDLMTRFETGKYVHSDL